MVETFDKWIDEDGGAMDMGKRKWLEVSDFSKARIYANAGFLTIGLIRSSTPEDGDTGHGVVIGPSKTAATSVWQGNPRRPAGEMSTRTDPKYFWRYFVSLRPLRTLD